MAFLVDPKHLLDLRLGLQQKILGGASAEDEHAGFATGALCAQHQGGRFVDVPGDIDFQPVPPERHRRDIHPDRAVAGGGGVDRHAIFVGGSEERFVAEPQHALPLANVFPAAMMEFGAAHFSLELRAGDDLAEKGIGGEEDGVIEKDIVDAHDAFLPQHDVVHVRVALMQGESDAEMGVVIQIGARRDDPVDESMLDERDEGGDPEPGRGQCSREAYAHRDVGGQHFPCKQLTRFPQACGIIGEKRVLNQLYHRIRARDGAWVDPSSLQQASVLCHGHSADSEPRERTRIRLQSKFIHR